MPRLLHHISVRYLEMFEEVSLQAELGAYVVALEVGGVHS